MEKLAARGRERFEARAAPGGDMHEIHVAVREWAYQYEDPDLFWPIIRDDVL
jgi:hypothetical protein